MSRKLIKIIILGDADAHKTDLLVSYCDDEAAVRRS